MPPCFIWGEPYGQAWLLEHLTAPVRALSTEYPGESFVHDGTPPEQLAERFIANLYPPRAHLRSAYRSFVERLLAEPSKPYAARWGAKFVRGSSEHAAFLKWLFPQCRILFLIRNPYDCLESWAAWRQANINGFDQWPSRPLTASIIAETWRRNTASFLEDYLKLDAKIVRYEQLAEGRLEDIEEYLGFDLNRQAARLRIVGGPEQRGQISESERISFQQQVGGLATQLGYTEGAGDAQAEPSPPVAIAATSQSQSALAPSQVCVLVPVGGAVEQGCENGLRALEQLGYTVRRVRGFSAIDQGRNVMASAALRDGFLATMWIDSDVAFEPGDVEKLREHNLPIVCGIYPKKKRRELACHLMPGSEAVMFGQAGGLLEIKYAGAGFLYVRADAYHTMQQQLRLPLCNEHFGEAIVPYFQPLVTEEDGKRWYLAEDYAFCHRARQCGYSIVADTTIRLRHIGTYEYSWEDAGAELSRYATFKLNLFPPAPPQEP